MDFSNASVREELWFAVAAIVDTKNFERWDCHELSAEVPQGK
jgi:hypothetical protein